MLQVKHKGLSVDLDTFTGMVTLRYHYPITKDAIAEFTDVAIAYNLTIVSFRNKNFAVYTITADSISAFETFRLVQKQLMLLSRQCKIVKLNAEIANLQQ